MQDRAPLPCSDVCEGDKGFQGLSAGCIWDISQLILAFPCQMAQNFSLALILYLLLQVTLSGIFLFWGFFFGTFALFSGVFNLPMMINFVSKVIFYIILASQIHNA